MNPPAPRRTHEQPRRDVVRRYRVAGVTWVVLDCGHEEPATGLDLATALRCQDCPPIRRPDAPPLPVTDHKGPR